MLVLVTSIFDYVSLFPVLQNVLFYSEFLICNKRDKLTGNSSPLYTAIIFCALSKNLQARNLAKQVILKFGKADHGADIILELLAEFAYYISNLNMKVIFIHSIVHYSFVGVK